MVVIAKYNTSFIKSFQHLGFCDCSRQFNMYNKEILVPITVTQVMGICDRTYKTERNLHAQWDVKGMGLGNDISEILVSEADLETCSLEKAS